MQLSQQQPRFPNRTKTAITAGRLHTALINNDRRLEIKQLNKLKNNNCKR